jgi:transglutaminase-like putative cysteine protease
MLTPRADNRSVAAAPNAPGKVPADGATAPAAGYRIQRLLRVTHLLDYQYTRPVRDVCTRLRLAPPPERGTRDQGQRLLDERFRFAPLPVRQQRAPDAFGNVLAEVTHETVQAHLTIVAELAVATWAIYGPDGYLVPAPIPPAPGEDPDAFREPTALTLPDAGLLQSARAVAAAFDGQDAARLAFALGHQVFRRMEYATRSTHIGTTAAEAWAGGRGVCQDYAHVLLALCRASGLPARYVSGFLPGEGAMHAWVEAFVPPGGADGGGWIGLDPTHDRWANERYVAVAVGRDYADITPTSGTFYGPGPGTLRHHSRVVIENTHRGGGVPL